MASGVTFDDIMNTDTTGTTNNKPVVTFDDIMNTSIAPEPPTSSVFVPAPVTPVAPLAKLPARLPVKAPVPVPQSLSDFHDINKWKPSNDAGFTSKPIPKFTDLQFLAQYEANNPAPPAPSMKDSSVLTVARYSHYQAVKIAALKTYKQQNGVPNQSPLQALQTFNRAIQNNDPVSTAKAIMAWNTIVDSGRTDVFLPLKVINAYAATDYKGAMALKQKSVRLATQLYQSTHNGDMPLSNNPLSMLPDVGQAFRGVTGNKNQNDILGAKAYQYLKSLGLGESANPVADVHTADEWAAGTMPKVLGKNWDKMTPAQKKTYLNALGIQQQEQVAQTKVQAGYQKSAGLTNPNTRLSIAAAGIGQLPIVGDLIISPSELQLDPGIYGTSKLALSIPQFIAQGMIAKNLMNKVVLKMPVSMTKGLFGNAFTSNTITGTGANAVIDNNPFAQLTPVAKDILSEMMVNTGIPVQGAIGRSMRGEKVNPGELTAEIIKMNLVLGASGRISGKLGEALNGINSDLKRVAAKSAVGGAVGVGTNMLLQGNGKLLTPENLMFGILGAIHAGQADRSSKISPELLNKVNNTGNILPNDLPAVIPNTIVNNTVQPDIPQTPVETAVARPEIPAEVQNIPIVETQPQPANIDASLYLPSVKQDDIARTVKNIVANSGSRKLNGGIEWGLNGDSNEIYVGHSVTGRDMGTIDLATGEMNPATPKDAGRLQQVSDELYRQAELSIARQEINKLANYPVKNKDVITAIIQKYPELASEYSDINLSQAPAQSPVIAPESLQSDQSAPVGEMPVKQAGETRGEIFIRKSTPKEEKSQSAKSDAFTSIPDKEGYLKVYKLYGPDGYSKSGRGFYYVPDNTPNSELTGIIVAEPIVKSEPAYKSPASEVPPVAQPQPANYSNERLADHPVLWAMRKSELPEYNMNPEIVKLNAFVDKVRELDPKDESDKHWIGEGNKYEVTISYPHSLGEHANITDFVYANKPTIDELKNDIQNHYKDEITNLKGNPLPYGGYAISGRDENIIRELEKTQTSQPQSPAIAPESLQSDKSAPVGEIPAQLNTEVKQNEPVTTGQQSGKKLTAKDYELKSANSIDVERQSQKQFLAENNIDTTKPNNFTPEEKTALDNQWQEYHKEYKKQVEASQKKLRLQNKKDFDSLTLDEQKQVFDDYNKNITDADFAVGAMERDGILEYTAKKAGKNYGNVKGGIFNGYIPMRVTWKMGSLSGESEFSVINDPHLKNQYTGGHINSEIGKQFAEKLSTPVPAKSPVPAVKSEATVIPAKETVTTSREDMEAKANEIGNNPKKLEKDLRDRLLALDSKKRMGKGTFDFENKRIISDDGEFQIVWSNKETSRGTARITEMPTKVEYDYAKHLESQGKPGEPVVAKNATAEPAPVPEVKGTASGGMAATASTVFTDPKATPAQKRQAVAAEVNANREAIVTPLQQITQPVVDDILKTYSPASRGANAKLTANSLRAGLGELARKSAVAVKATMKMKKAFDKLSQGAKLEFIDNMENGRSQATPELTAASNLLRKLLDNTKVEVQKTGKLQDYIENYFPHIWADPKLAEKVFAQIFGKKNLQGSKNFLKQRTIPTVKDGVSWRVYDKNGTFKESFPTQDEATQYADDINGEVHKPLELLTDNPVELTLLKLHEMNKFLMGTQFMNELKQEGLAIFLTAEMDGKTGFVKLNDPMGTVVTSNTHTAREAYDEILMQQLTAFADKLGIRIERGANMPKGRPNAWGTAEGKSDVKTRTGSPESVLMHEIGHILGNRYNLFEYLTKKGGDGEGGKTIRVKGVSKARQTIKNELRALSLLRAEGMGNISKSFRTYLMKGAEKEAIILQAYLYDNTRFHEVAPVTAKAFDAFIESRPELQDLRNIRRSFVLGSRAETVKDNGIVTLGNWWVPQEAATIINNYTSPGLRGDWKYDILRGIGNTMNQAQLGLSAFHLMFTTIDATVSEAAIGIMRLSHGQIGGALDITKALIPGYAPIENIIRGNKLLNAYETEFNEITDPVMKEMVLSLVRAGGRTRMDTFYKNNSVDQFMKALRTAGDDTVTPLKRVGSGGIALGKLFPATFELIAKPLMEEIVPRQKLGVFVKMAQFELSKMSAEDKLDVNKVRDAMARAWDSVDNRMGQMIYDNLFWNKNLKDIGMLSVRSLGWNLGTIRELGGAGVDTVTGINRVSKGDNFMTHRIAYAIALVAITALYGATYQYLRTGKGPEELKDYIFPKTGKILPNGSPERVSMPTYMKDVYAYTVDPWGTIANKLHPLFGSIIEMFLNKDYFGTQIRNKDDSTVEQAKQLAEYMATRFMPFSARNAMRFNEEGDTSGMWQSFFGITPAPKSVNQTPAEKIINEYNINHRAPMRTKAEADLSKKKYDLLVRHKKGENISADLNQMVKDGTLTSTERKYFIRNSGADPRDMSLKRMPIVDALKVWAVADDEEKKRWRIIMGRKFAVEMSHIGGEGKRKLLELARKSHYTFRQAAPVNNGASSLRTILGIK